MLRAGGHSTSVVSGGRRKVHTTFEDGGEMVEEYDMKTSELIVRKRRTKTAIGKVGEWEVLQGDAEARRWNPDTMMIGESTQNPQFSRKDTAACFQWRVRNLPYPEDNYNLSVDHAARKVVIRTNNKKYYKKFDIPELDVIDAPLEEAALTWHHANNTLVISYKKPAKVVQAEKADIAEQKKMSENDIKLW